MSESDIEQVPQEPWNLLLTRLTSSPGMSANDAISAMARVLAYLGDQVTSLRRQTDAAASLTQLELRAAALAKARKHVEAVVKGSQAPSRYSESAKLTYKDQLAEELRIADFLLKGARV